MSDAKIRRITKLMNELNADGDVKNTGLESAYTSNAYASDVFVSNNYLDSGVTTLTDAQGNVRALERNAIISTPYDFPSGSSGKYFVCAVNSLTINIDAADISTGDIFTIWSFPGTGDVTISWTNMTDGVFIVGDTSNKGTSGSITLAVGGLCTVICDTGDRMVFNGNVS